MEIQFQSNTLTIFESALFRTTSSVVIKDDFILVIDPNWLPEEVAFIKAFVEERSEGKTVYLLFTHSDYDHIIGYNAFPNAIVIASKTFVDNPGKESILQQIKVFDDQYYISRNYAITYPKVEIEIRDDGQQVKLGDTELTFYQAQGHNRDGIITIIASLGIWIVGDYLSNIEFPYIYHSSDDYLETLDKVEKALEIYPLNMLITGHGDHTSSKKEVQKRIIDSRNYIKGLRKSILEKKEFDFNQLMESYDFPIGMKAFHDANVMLLTKELGL